MTPGSASIDLIDILFWKDDDTMTISMNDTYDDKMTGLECTTGPRPFWVQVALNMFSLESAAKRER